ncbi:MAG: amidohydrolase family protein [Deltaproteobacteria bacterium]
MIVDCHCHLWTAPPDGGPWEGATPLARYLSRAARAGIDRTILFAAPQPDYDRANRAVAAVVARHPDRLDGFAFVHARAQRGRIHAVVREAVESYGFRGIKVHRLDAPITQEICEAARAFDLPITYDVMAHSSEVEALASSFADVVFIIPHLSSFDERGAIPAQLALVSSLVRFPNVYADTSAVRTFDVLAYAVRRAGSHKVLFGTDGPWLHPGLELAKVRALGLPAADERLILGGNVLRILGGRRRRAPLRRHLRDRVAPAASGAPDR